MSGNRKVALARPFSNLLLVSLLALWQLGCGNSRVPGAGTGLPPAGSGPPSANISLSPGTAVEGSPDLTLTVIARQPFSFTSAGHKFNQVVWTADGTDTVLATTFVSNSELTAVVPAPLLANPLQANVRVEVWDRMGDGPGPDVTSSSVTFSVTTPSTASPSITSISPATAKAGSSGVVISINGSNFHNQFLHTSVAFWATDANNLHDSGTMLHTTFVSSSQLTAVVPAALLQNSLSLQIIVLTGDLMGMSDGYFGYPKSNSVILTVTP